MTTMRQIAKRLSVYIGLIAIVSVGVGIITYLVRSSQPETYEAVARFSITPNQTLLDGAPADLVESVAALDRPIVNATVSELLQSGLVADDAARAIGLPDGTLDDYDFSATEVPGAAIVRLSITGPDETSVAALAQAVRETDLDIAREFVGVFDVRSIDSASVGVSKVAPNPTRDAIAAALATAVGLGALAVVLDGRLRRRPAPER